MAYRSCRVNNHDLQLFTDASEGTGLRSLFEGSWEGSALTSQVGEAKQQSKHPSLGAAFHWGWHLRLGRSQGPQEKPVVLQAINKSTRSVINPERGEGSQVQEPMRTHEHTYACAHTAVEDGALHFVHLSAGSDVQEVSCRIWSPQSSGLDPGLSSLYAFKKKSERRIKAKWCFSLKHYY